MYNSRTCIKHVVEVTVKLKKLILFFFCIYIFLGGILHGINTKAN